MAEMACRRIRVPEKNNLCVGNRLTFLLFTAKLCIILQGLASADASRDLGVIYKDRSTCRSHHQRKRLKAIRANSISGGSQRRRARQVIRAHCLGICRCSSSYQFSAYTHVRLHSKMTLLLVPLLLPLQPLTAPRSTLMT